MKFQYLSDIHIEYKNDQVPDPLKYITPGQSTTLILAGDIGSLYKFNQLRFFLKALCTYFSTVLYVPGNHEFYQMTGYEPLQWPELLQRLSILESEIPNLHVLDRRTIVIDNVRIIGCTLWSDIKCPLPRFISRIHGDSTQSYRKRYQNDMRFLRRAIAQPSSLPMLVVTHYPPTYRVVTTKRDRFVSLYASHLDDLVDSPCLNTWICGHVHVNFDIITQGNARIVSNQKGKPRDKIRDFKKCAIVSIPSTVSP